jgi:hypothetical protein
VAIGKRLLPDQNQCLSLNIEPLCPAPRLTDFEQYNEQYYTDSGKKDGKNVSGAGSARPEGGRPHKRLLNNMPFSFSLRLCQFPGDLLPMAECVGQSFRGKDGGVNFP